MSNIRKMTALALLWALAMPTGGAWGAEISMVGSPTAQALRLNSQFSDMAGHWARDAVYSMAAQGVVRGMGDSAFEPDRPMSREEAMALLIRAMGLEGKGQQRAEEAANRNTLPANAVARWARASVLLAKDQSIISEAELRRLRWSDPVTREEMATWLAKAAGLAPVYDQAQQEVYTFTDWQAMTPANVPFVEAVLGKGLMRGETGAAGRLFRPKDGLTRAEAAAVLHQANELFAGKRGVSIHKGVVRNIEGNSAWGQAGENAGTTLWVEGEGDLIRISLNRGGAAPRDILVLKEGTLGGPEKLAVGDAVEVYSKPLGDTGREAFFIHVPSSYEQWISGSLQYIDPANREIVVLDDRQQTNRLKWDDGTTVYVNDTLKKPTDLAPGMDVQAQVFAGRLISLRVDFYADHPGYQAPGEKLRFGKVTAVGNGLLTVEDSQGRRGEYSYSDATRMRKGDRFFSMQDLRVGDTVTLSFDGDRLIQVEVPQLNNTVKAVYRGRLSEAVPGSGELMLSDVEILKGAVWQADQSMKKIDLAADTPLYVPGGAPITPYELSRYYRGERVYLAVGDDYGGREKVLRLVVAQGRPYLYADQIGRVSNPLPGSGSLYLKKQMIDVNYDEGTIVLYNGRLVDSRQIAANRSLVVEMDNRVGSSYAAVVSLGEQQATHPRIVQGQIKEFADNEVVLKRYFELEDNAWTDVASTSETINLKASLGTTVFEWSGSTVNEVPVQDVLAWGDASSPYKNKHAIAVMKGDEILALAISDRNYLFTDSLPTVSVIPANQQIVVGKVSSKTTLNSLIQLTDVQTYGFNDAWNPMSANMTVDASKALVIRGDRVTDYDDIRAGDSLYLAYINTGSGSNPIKALVIFIQ